MGATNTLDSSQVDVTQPVMAELQKYDDVLVTSGDLLETSALPPRVNISVCQPTLAQTSSSSSSSSSTNFIATQVLQKLQGRYVSRVSQVSMVLLPVLCVAVWSTSNLFVSKADSSFQTGTCLSQSDHKSNILLSPITNQPLTMHDTPSLAANEILTALPLAPNHTISNHTHLHHTVVPTHTSTPHRNSDSLTAFSFT